MQQLENQLVTSMEKHKICQQEVIYVLLIKKNFDCSLEFTYFFKFYKTILRLKRTESKSVKNYKIYKS